MIKLLSLIMAIIDTWRINRQFNRLLKSVDTSLDKYRAAGSPYGNTNSGRTKWMLEQYEKMRKNKNG